MSMPDGAPCPSDASAVVPQADVGVLLVHGIGDHAEGDTLLAFGDPLIDWLREWMAGGRGGSARGSVSVGETRLRARRNEVESPAYSVVDIAQPAAAAGPRQERWLFVESWWGDSVHPPGVFPLLGWMFTRVPLLVVWHFFGGGRNREPPSSQLQQASRSTWNAPVPEWIAWAGKAVSTPLLILVMQATIVVAAILSLVPFGAWRDAVLAAVRVMTLTLGDSFVLLEQDIQRAALADRVARSLQWLQSRASRVIVVAHSQGGAIAHDALQHGTAPDLFISVGSGLEKLEFLRLVRSSRRGLVAATVAAPAAALGVTGLAAGLFGWIEVDAGWWVVPGALALLGYVFSVHLWDVIKRYRSDLEQALAASALAMPAGSQRWHDVYATLDLVPMGRGSLLPPLPHIERVELRNECSFVTDHVSYFHSSCGFTAWFWATMQSQSRLTLVDAEERAALRQLGLWHARRAFAIGFGGGLAPLAIVFGTLVFTEAMAAMGQVIFDALAAANMGWTRRVLDAVMSGLARGVGLLPGFDSGPGDLLRRNRVLVAATVSLVALGAWSVLIRLLWRTDGQARWRAACRGTSTLTGPRAIWLGVPMVLFWCIAAMLPLLAVMIVSSSPDAFTLGGLGRAVARVVAVLLTLVALAIGFAPAWWNLFGEEEFMKRRGHPAWPLATAAAMAFYGWLASMLWSVGSGAHFDERLFAAALLACAVGWVAALAIRYRIPAWQSALLSAIGPVAIGATSAVASLDSAMLGVLPASLLVLGVAGVVRWAAMRHAAGVR